MDISRVMLADKVAIVTGGGRGLGKGFAQGLAACYSERSEESRSYFQATRFRTDLKVCPYDGEAAHTANLVGTEL